MPTNVSRTPLVFFKTDRSITASSLQPEFSNTNENEDLKNIENEIKKVNTQIDEVEGEIKELDTLIKESQPNSAVWQYYVKEKKALREEKKALRDKEQALRREKELLLKKSLLMLPSASGTCFRQHLLVL